MRIFIRLIGYGLRHKVTVFLAYLATGLSVVSGLAMPWLAGSAIDEALGQALESGVFTQLFILAAAIVVAGALRGIFSYAQNYLSEAISQKTAYDIRNDLFAKLQNLSFGFHDRQQTGDLMSKATADIEAVQRFMSSALIRGLSMAATFAVAAAIMFSFNWRLAVVVMVFIPPVLWRAVHMSRKLRSTWGAVQEATGRMTSALQENLAGIRVVKVFGARRHAERQFAEHSDAVRDLTYSATKQFAFHGSLMTLIFTAATGAVLWFGGREIAADRLTAGQLAMFIFYVGMMAAPVRMMGFMVNMFTRAHAAGQRIFDVLDEETTVQDRPNAKDLAHVRGHVRFQGVSMSYEDAGASVVRGIDFEAVPGQLTAILGAPGSGKSTLAHLVPRFYDVTDGVVSIDGVDVRDATLSSLRRNVGIVMQDVFVFGASIRDNIGYGAEGASLDRIVAAAKVAQLHDFIESTPRGYDTWVGERGVRLSGGQRQRLAIARTLLIDPPILILDDSTSSVDMGTEYQIQRAMEEVVVGRTTFVIAHRLSTVRRADLILVLDDGEVVERGSHEELMSVDGFYKRIYDMQLRPQESEAAAPVS